MQQELNDINKKVKTNVFVQQKLKNSKKNLKAIKDKKLLGSNQKI